ncbi:hypothetical protein GCK72_020083 [Caenorhabditis remanei]|uniref:Nuclear Hormone Receptor family n=1 Tax=Caenorhabditis remanei TaxID=31234 RepID=A0A6A5GFP4_CAERE|nr:hypothetical protein GCK72_020083 [Caenorhabditis remanei]KAF1753526.1 hypothetical protein GCK72_020083 [Caenorhabditis remanei]
MNTPSSSNSSPPDLPIVSINNCQVCGTDAHGNHFGAVTCRACAAFFRRFAIKNNFKSCKNNNKCKTPNQGWFTCKPCRLKRCKDLGMTIRNFQFDRDPYRTTSEKKTAELLKNIPPTMETFLGRSNLIVCHAKEPNDGFKYYVDLQYLLDKARIVLEKGSETPIHAANPLEKLALGLQQTCWPEPKRKKVVTKFGRDEMFALWEDEILKVAKWLTYFDEFQKLPSLIQLDIVKGVWNVWSRLERAATNAIARRDKVCKDNEMIAYVGKELLFGDMKNINIDLSWCTDYTPEQMKFFESHDYKTESDHLIKLMQNLQPTDVEISYMLCQLCFHQIGKQKPGIIFQLTEQFQETLSNHLHDYYVNRLNSPKYADRIMNMMKVNNTIQQYLYQDKVKSELKKVFDVYFVKYSHPDLIMNY